MGSRSSWAPGNSPAWWLFQLSASPTVTPSTLPRVLPAQLGTPRLSTSGGLARQPEMLGLENQGVQQGTRQPELKQELVHLDCENEP